MRRTLDAAQCLHSSTKDLLVYRWWRKSDCCRARWVVRVVVVWVFVSLAQIFFIVVYFSPVFLVNFFCTKILNCKYTEGICVTSNVQHGWPLSITCIWTTVIISMVISYANYLDKQTRLYFKDYFCMWQITISIKHPWKHGYISQGPNNQPTIYCIIPALI